MSGIPLDPHSPLHQVQVNPLTQQQPVHHAQQGHGVQLPRWLTELPRRFREVRQTVSHNLQQGAQALRGKFAQAGVSTARFFQNMGTRIKTLVSPDTLAKHHATFTLNLGGQQVTVDGRILATKLPPGTDVAQVIQGIQAKVTRGAQHYQNIMNGTRQSPPSCTTQEMTDLAWFLQVKSEAKTGQHFRDYSVSLPDPNNRLGTFLDSHTRAYQRDSSHVEFFQQLGGGTHRGIDATGSNPNNLDDVLPYNLKTMLFGKLAQNNPRKLPENRLFVKLEVHGCPWANKLMLRRSGVPFDVNGPQGNFKRTWTEIGHSIGHLFTFLTGNPRMPGGHFPLTERKERIPKTLKTEFKALTRLADRTNNQTLKNMIRDGIPTDTSSGVRVLYANARDALQYINQQNLTGPQVDALRQKLQTFIQSTANDAQMDHPELRFGQEIIFQANEF